MKLQTKAHTGSKRVLAGALTALIGLTGAAQAQSVKIDDRLPDYEPTRGVSGSIKSVGSDTMNNLMTLWGEAYIGFYPNISLEVEGKGSSTAPPALIAGSSTFGPMSREMKGEEVDEFQKAFGYEPTPLPTGIDMLAVYVHKDNPIGRSGLTLQQVDAIFSKTRNGGHQSDITTWGDLGLEGEWASKPISIYGRNSASGTYGYFKKKALFKGDFKDSVKERPGSAAVVQGVASDKFAIGYSGIGYKTADVLAVPLAIEEGEEMIGAIAANAYTGEYPLARFLWLYVNYKPGTKLDPLRAEFIKVIFSHKGQENVVEDGYFPVTAEIAKRALSSVGLTVPQLDENLKRRPGGN